MSYRNDYEDYPVTQIKQDNLRGYAFLSSKENV